MNSDTLRSPLAYAVARYRSAFLAILLLSSLLNILLLAGSIYMLLIYDSVLVSHSLPTLLALFALVIVIYGFQGLFDGLRSRILNDVAVGVDRELSPRVQRAMHVLALRQGGVMGDGLAPMRDLDQVRSFLASNGPTTLIDLPWILFFLGILFLLHVWLGVTALVGTLVMIALTVATDRTTRGAMKEIGQIATYRAGMAETNLRHVELVTAMGMFERLRLRWDHVNSGFLARQNQLAGVVGTLGGLSRTFRLFLQSAILTVGAVLVINGDATGGIIFASSIIAGRALAPVDQAIANWRGFAGARGGWSRLQQLLAQIPEDDESMVELPLPSRDLQVEGLVVAPPGSTKVTVNGVQFRLAAGEALGVVGPSGAGKTSLARALIGVWPAARGSVRLDGATLDQWAPERLGKALGYLPQSVELLDGTIAENIARFEPSPDSQAVIAAAKAAGVHEMIVQMASGYDTPVGRDGSQLSAGQRQRIGLARALYGDPFLVVLDEPNSNLDQAGELALNEAIVAIRERGGIVVVIAHRPSMLAHVSHILLLVNGRMEKLGPREQMIDQIIGKPIPLNKPKDGGAAG